MDRPAADAQHYAAPNVLLSLIGPINHKLRYRLIYASFHPTLCFSRRAT